jgi:hypothetical protein
VHPDYKARIADMRLMAQKANEEARAHLEALPDLDTAAAMESIETIRTDVNEIEYAIGRIHVLTRLANGRKAPDGTH